MFRSDATPQELQEILQDKEVSQEVEAALGKAYGPYISAVNICEKSLEGIVRDISGLIPDCQVSDRSQRLKR